MPATLPKPCSYLGCPHSTTVGSYCNKHRKHHEQQRILQRRAYERIRNRPTAAQRGYNAEWQRIRAQVKRQQPYCARCGTKSTTEIHHRLPLSQGGTNDRANLIGLCTSCHHNIHQSINGGRGR